MSDTREEKFVTRPASFVQIATGATSNRTVLYALDSEGSVWEYVWPGSLCGEALGGYWKPLKMERHS